MGGRAKSLHQKKATEFLCTFAQDLLGTMTVTMAASMYRVVPVCQALFLASRGGFSHFILTGRYHSPTFHMRQLTLVEADKRLPHPLRLALQVKLVQRCELNLILFLVQMRKQTEGEICEPA